jgi:hypothetical protein
LFNELVRDRSPASMDIKAPEFIEEEGSRWGTITTSADVML